MQIFAGLLSNIALYTGIFALVNLGLVLLYKSTGILSFAQGYLLMAGAYVMASLQPRVGFWLALAVSIVAIGAVGWLIYMVIGRVMLGASEFTKAISTFMVALLVAQVVAIVWGTSSRTVSSPVAGGVKIGGGVLTWASVGTAAFAVIALAIVFLLLQRTMAGLRMRALSQDPSLAMYGGMSIHVLSSIAWAVAGGLAAVAGVAYAQATAVTLSLSDVGLLAFPAAVVGGLISLKGSFVGAFLLATISTLANYRLGGSWGNVVVYSVMLVVLTFFPFGIFGAPSSRRL